MIIKDPRTFNRSGINVDRVIVMPISVAERSKARDCGRSFAEVAGSNPAGRMDVCVVFYSKDNGTS